jgi:hypothetical protein
MLLNSTDTARLKTAIDCKVPFFTWLKNDVASISNTRYNEIRADFQAWSDAYVEGDLQITTANGPEVLTGIDQVPIPPAR